jgi:hypothetical protein
VSELAKEKPATFELGKARGLASVLAAEYREILRTQRQLESRLILHFVDPVCEIFRTASGLLIAVILSMASIRLPEPKLQILPTLSTLF